VPRELNDGVKINQMDFSLQHLLGYADEEYIWLRGLLLEMNHGCTTTNLNQSIIKHPSSHSTKKFQVTPSAGKVMLTMFWDLQGVLLAHFQKHSENVNSASHCEVLLKFRGAIHRKYPGQLVTGVLLHHDNARPHTGHATQERIQNYSGNFFNIHLRGPSPLKITLVANVSLMTKVETEV
jgi:hypothetical protein